MKNYRELAKLKSFLDRFHYLKLDGRVGSDTFGFDRWVNQQFYRSREWRHIRHRVIARDHGCDLGIEGREIPTGIYIHHMNPLSIADIEMSADELLDPDYLVCTSRSTHNAIHYGDADLLIQDFVERRPNDTVPWRK